MKIRKRDGRIVAFDDSKITDAIFAAAQAVGGADREMAVEITLCVLKCLKAENKEIVDVEHVQDIVEKVLIKKGHAKTAKSYILYRAKRTDIRNARSELMDTVAEILKETDRDNANISNSPSAKMLQIASAASREYYLNRVIPEEMAAAHKRGDIHIHDLDFYGKTLNCLNIPLGRLLHEGFNNGHGYIRPPKRPGSAAALAAIVLQSNQNDMFGGQSFGFFDTDMADFVEGAEENEVFQAMEALVYNLNSMHSRAGAQVPFSSLNLGLDTSENGRKVTRNLLKAYGNGLGRGDQVDVNTADTAVGLQQIAELCRNFLTFVRADFQGDEAFLFIVRMICCKKGIFLIRCHSSWLCCHSLGSGSFYLFNRVLHIGQCIHSKFPPYFSISRLL